jgi:hypothetical protein
MLATLGLVAGACSSQAAGEDGSRAAGGGDGPDLSPAGSGGQAGERGGPTDECLEPVYSAESGTESCTTSSGDVYVHRKAVGAGCNYEPPERASKGGAGGQGPDGDCQDCEEGRECFEDSDCSGRYPYCDQDVFGGAQCSEGCLTDDDCSPSQVCSCVEDGPGRCLGAGCRTDADCGAGFRCVAEYDDCVGYESDSEWFSCQRADDECLVDSDCADAHANCVEEGGRRVCLVPEGVCGRPLLVAGAARLAHAALRPDWRTTVAQAAELAPLTELERAELAQHYTEMALMEHASIAAFARFSLQLLGLGAPPALVTDCNAAIADETRHARLCFELASRYARFDLGPSALDVSDCLESSALPDVLELVIAEGCVGETIAALEAAEAAAHALDPAVSDVLSQIVDDERRHAELAYRFVAWALLQQPTLEPLVRRAFAEACRARRDLTPATAAPSASLRAHGLLSQSQRQEVALNAVRDVIQPCATALLRRARPAAPSPSLHPA